MSSVRHRTDARTADLLFLTGPIQGPDWRWGPWEGGSCDGQRCLADCGALDSDTEVRCLVWASGARVCARVIVRRAGRDGKRLTTALHCCCSGKALTLSWSRSRRSVRCDGSGLRWRFHTGAIAQLVAQIHAHARAGRGPSPVGRALSCGWRRNCLPSSPPVRSRQERGPSSM
jgi:hypothetical protein